MIMTMVSDQERGVLIERVRTQLNKLHHCRFFFSCSSSELKLIKGIPKQQTAKQTIDKFVSRTGIC